MNIFFRVDASFQIGSGHIMRSLVLADIFKEQGCNVVFLSRLLDGNLIDLTEKRGFEVRVVGGDEENSNTARLDGLSCSQKSDANNTIVNFEGKLIDILFVDHYELSIDWETLIRPYVKKIVVIEDLEKRNHNCDFLINQNFRNYTRNDYKDLVPEACKTLLGPQYAILSPEYRDFRKGISRKIGNIKRVLVYFGGTDWQNMTNLALRVLSQDEFLFLKVDVVVGSNYPFLSDLGELVSSRPKTNLHQSLPNLAKLMSDADIAIGAGGTTTWERMSMGLRALVISLAENQMLTCELLQKEGLIDYLGSYRDISDGLLTKYLKESLRNPEDNYNISNRISKYVDGFGALRIVQAMEL